MSSDRRRRESQEKEECLTNLIIIDLKPAESGSEEKE